MGNKLEDINKIKEERVCTRCGVGEKTEELVNCMLGLECWSCVEQDAFDDEAELKYHYEKT